MKMKATFDQLWPSLFCVSQEIEGVRTDKSSLVPRVTLTKLSDNQISRLLTSKTQSFRKSKKFKARKFVIHSDSDTDEFDPNDVEPSLSSRLSDSSNDSSKNHCGNKAKPNSPLKENCAPSSYPTSNKEKSSSRLSGNVDPEILKKVAASLKDIDSTNSMNSFIQDLAKGTNAKRSDSLAQKASLNFDDVFELAQKSVTAGKGIKTNLGLKESSLLENIMTPQKQATSNKDDKLSLNSLMDKKVVGEISQNGVPLSKKSSNVDATSNLKKGGFHIGPKSRTNDVPPSKNSESKESSMGQPKLGMEKVIKSGPKRKMMDNDTTTHENQQYQAKKKKISEETNQFFSKFKNMVTIPKDSLTSQLRRQKFITNREKTSIPPSLSPNVDPVETDPASEEPFQNILRELLIRNSNVDGSSESEAPKEPVKDDTFVAIPLNSVINVSEENLKDNTLEIQTLDDISDINKAVDSILDKLKKHKLELEREYEEEVKKLKNKYDLKIDKTEAKSREFRHIALSLLDEKLKKRPGNELKPDEDLKIKLKEMFCKVKEEKSPENLSCTTKDLETTVSMKATQGGVAAQETQPADEVVLNPVASVHPKSTGKETNAVTSKETPAFRHGLIRPIREANVEYFGHKDVSESPDPQSKELNKSLPSDIVVSQPEIRIPVNVSSTNQTQSSASDQNTSTVLGSILSPEITVTSKSMYVVANSNPVTVTTVATGSGTYSPLTTTGRESTQPKRESIARSTANTNSPPVHSFSTSVSRSSATIYKSATTKSSHVTVQATPKFTRVKNATTTSAPLSSVLTPISQAQVTSNADQITNISLHQFRANKRTPHSKQSVNTSKSQQSVVSSNNAPLKTTSISQLSGNTQDQVRVQSLQQQNLSQTLRQQQPVQAKQQQKQTIQSKLQQQQQRPIHQSLQQQKQQSVVSSQQQSVVASQQQSVIASQHLSQPPVQSLQQLPSTFLPSVGNPLMPQKIYPKPMPPTHFQQSQPVNQKNYPQSSVSNMQPVASGSSFQPSSITQNSQSSQQQQYYYSLPTSQNQPFIINQQNSTPPSYQHAMQQSTQLVFQSPNMQTQFIYQPQVQSYNPNIPLAEVDSHGRVVLKTGRDVNMTSTDETQINNPTIFNMQNIVNENQSPIQIDSAGSGCEDQSSDQSLPIITGTVSLAQSNATADLFCDEELDQSSKTCFLCGMPASIVCCGQFVYCNSGCKEIDSERHRSECRAKN